MIILPFFFSVYIFSFILYGEQKHLFPNYLAVYNNNIRSASNFHLPFTNLTKYQKAFHYATIKISNNFPTHIKCVANGI